MSPALSFAYCLRKELVDGGGKNDIVKLDSDNCKGGWRS